MRKSIPLGLSLLLIIILILTSLTACAQTSVNLDKPSVITIEPVASHGLPPQAKGEPQKKKISSPGEYSGYSEEIYNSVVLSSKYIYIRGNNLAIDIYRPSLDGITPVATPYPALFQDYNYGREAMRKGVSRQQIEGFVKRGYVVAILDPRGSGASFGHRDYVWNQEEMIDGKEVIEWLARQSYCDGKVGMFGVSYMGGAQMLIAAQKPPHLVSIAPVVTTIDQFARHPNGVFLSMAFPSSGDRARDANPGYPVDADPNGTMAAAAVPEHVAENHYLDDCWPGPTVYRNDFIAEIGVMPSLASSPINYLDEIKGSGVAMYNMAGWWDQAPTGQFGAWKIWGGRLIVGPWTHGVGNEDMAFTEHLRWFDYTLKGIDNKLYKEDPIYYATMFQTSKTELGATWKSSTTWPLPDQVLTNFYFNDIHSGTVSSVNDGGLATVKPTSPGSPDVYTVDSSQVKVFDGKFKENARYWNGDMTINTDAKGLTYTTTALTEDMEVTGHPVVHLWASSDQVDGDFFAFLEEVDATGKSQMVTNGMIRASCRKLSEQSPWTEMGLPYHRCYDVDAEYLTPDVPQELLFDCYPTSWLFKAGSHIRVTITGSNSPIYPAYMDGANVSVYHDKDHASCITLPVIP